MKTITRLIILPFLTAVLASTVALGQTPDTVFMRYDHNYDDTLIYKTDTLISKSGMTRQILIGTAILPSTHSQMWARGYQLYDSKVTKSDCKKDFKEWGPHDSKINYIINTDSTLTVDINITDNCCYEFLCDISVDSTATLNLIYYGYGTYCACDCCFGLTYHFNKVKLPDYSEIKAVMINGNRKTIKSIKK